jgi:SAM-dependent methyltransferase
MGISRSDTLLFMMELKKQPFNGSILQLGRQDIFFDYTVFTQYAAENNVTLNNVEVSHRDNPWLNNVQTIDDSTFFKSLGFDKVHSLDASGFEDATYVADLNHPVPESLHGKYDVVFNGGTLEHVFNVPVALCNIHNLLKVGGKHISYLPTHNFVDHGFYQFSPTLFLDYYTLNRYEIITSYLVGHKMPFNHNSIPTLFEYSPEKLAPISHGGINKETFNGCELIGTFFTVIKTEDSVANLYPQQGYYQKKWAEK